MTPERWRRVKDVLASALEREEEQRPHFLSEACGSDVELRGAVESLIQADALELIPTDPLPRIPLPPPPPPRLAAGSRLGHYEVSGLLAAGGMGEVYRARDTRLGRDVALKTLPSMVARDPARVSRLEREARAASALNHPHIVTVYDFGETSDHRYIVMELVEGTSVRALLAEGPLSTERLLASGRRWPTRSRPPTSGDRAPRPEPENVLVTADGRAKIVDFGLARFMSAPAAARGPPPIRRPPAPARSWARGLHVSRAGAGPCRWPSAPTSLAARGRLRDGRRRRPFDHPTLAGTIAAILRDDPPLLTDGGVPQPCPG